MVEVEANLFWYLLLHYGVPVNYCDEDKLKQHFSTVRKACAGIGVTITHCNVLGTEGGVTQRYVFRFNRYRRNDALAVRIGEAFAFRYAVVGAPIVDPSFHDDYVLPIPRSFIKDESTLSLPEFFGSTDNQQLVRQSIRHLVSLSWVHETSEDDFEAAWRSVPLLLTHPFIFNAAAYLKASQDDFFVYPGQIREIEENYDSPPVTHTDQTRLETALHNAFKAIEAVIGDPPKDDKKLFARLRKVGINIKE